MPTWLLNKSTWLFIAITALVIGCVFVEYHIFTAGEQVATGKQATAQVKKDIKVRRTNAKIDQNTPYSASKSDAIKWLQQYTTDSK